MKLLSNGKASTRNITLEVSDCKKEIIVKRQNFSQIEDINSKTSLICRDNEIYMSFSKIHHTFGLEKKKKNYHILCSF